MNRYRLMTLAILILLYQNSPRIHAVEYYLYGTGLNANLTSGFQRDNNWDIVAIPEDNIIGSPSTPYDAYIPQATATQWIYGSPTTGATQVGYQVGSDRLFWMSPSSTSNTIVNIANTPAYNWIAKQTFTIPADDTYYFNFPASVDNRLRFVIDGSIDTSIRNFPDISGGTQIGPTNTATGQFTTITNYIGSAYLTAGTHTAYMVLYDFGGSTGVLIGTTVFSTTPIPEPSTYALATMAACTLAFIGRRKRSRNSA